ncbi:MAG TPA: hypothetical protein V6C91_21090 [Coleofasciculaceae cyanobacterium]
MRSPLTAVYGNLFGEDITWVGWVEELAPSTWIMLGFTNLQPNLPQGGMCSP